MTMYQAWRGQIQPRYSLRVDGQLLGFCSELRLCMRGLAGVRDSARTRGPMSAPAGSSVRVRVSRVAIY